MPAARVERDMEKKRAIVLGAGFGGSAAAARLSRLLPADEWEVVLVDRNNYLLFYPLLPEVAAGTLEPRHVVVPARSFLRKGRFVYAEVTGLDLERSRVHLSTEDEPAWSMRYDHLVLALGSVTRLPPVPGLREHGFELKTIADAASLRDHGISLLERASMAKDPELRRELLRVVVVGANFTGVELAGEYQDFLRDACRSYPELDPDDVDVVVVEARSRILPALPEKLADYARAHLERRGLRFATGRTVARVDRRGAELSDGTWLPSRTVAWCAGIAPNPLLAGCQDLPKNEQGYVETRPDLRVKGFDNVWAIGDSAFVPQPDGHGYPATAQVATRQGEHAARNIALAVRGAPLRPFAFRSRGALAALGCRTAVAEVFGLRIAGFPAWFLYRTVYLLKVPTLGRKLSIVTDWTVDLFAKQMPVQLGLHRRASETNGASRRDEARL